MSGVIVEEVRLLLISAAIGILLLLIYDGIRIFRNLIPHGSFFLALEHFLYWLAASLLIFWMVYRSNDGAMRGFIIGGAALGMIVGQLTFSSLLVRALSAVLGFPIRLIKKAVKKIGRKRRQKRIEKEQEIQ